MLHECGLNPRPFTNPPRPSAYQQRPFSPTHNYCAPTSPPSPNAQLQFPPKLFVNIHPKPPHAPYPTVQHLPPHTHLGTDKRVLVRHVPVVPSWQSHTTENSKLAESSDRILQELLDQLLDVSWKVPIDTLNRHLPPPAASSSSPLSSPSPAASSLSPPAPPFPCSLNRHLPSPAASSSSPPAPPPRQFLSTATHHRKRSGLMLRGSPNR